MTAWSNCYSSIFVSIDIDVPALYDTVFGLGQFFQARQESSGMELFNFPTWVYAGLTHIFRLGCKNLTGKNTLTYLATASATKDLL